ncbi:unnamed protein product [Protopolystoma xenopodis]|uniref:Uncharacterized protein n=1 Tax=Protopolystoma xenopodis TaxID=117903 RepID=A0A3S5BZH8_9PLAT|nr:unnamed protein product [Protopolystoma xenopodis]
MPSDTQGTTVSLSSSPLGLNTVVSSCGTLKRRVSVLIRDGLPGAALSSDFTNGPTSTSNSGLGLNNPKRRCPTPSLHKETHSRSPDAIASNCGGPSTAHFGCSPHSVSHNIAALAGGSTNSTAFIGNSTQPSACPVLAPGGGGGGSKNSTNNQSMLSTSGQGGQVLPCLTFGTESTTPASSSTPSSSNSSTFVGLSSYPLSSGASLAGLANSASYCLAQTASGNSTTGCRQSHATSLPGSVAAFTVPLLEANSTTSTWGGQLVHILNIENIMKIRMCIVFLNFMNYLNIN